MNIFHGILDLLLPRVCSSCGQKVKNTALLCDECAKELREYHQNECTFCGKAISTGHICVDCRKEYSFDDVFSGFHFTPVVQRLIHDFKYSELRTNGKFLSEQFATRLAHVTSFQHVDYIIPVPLHNTKRRERGFNQSDIIAQIISDKLDIPVLRKTVLRKKFTKTQTKLTKDAREKNVSDAFIVRDRDRLKEKSVVLVDDVLTTGATMKSIALLLRENLIQKVYVVTLARA